jgi:hypothetical protein
MSDALTQIKSLIEEVKREIHQRLDSLVVSARQIRTSSLSEISTILGLIQSFEFRTPGNPGRGENYSGVVIKTDGIETYFEDNKTGSIAQDGDVKFGSDVDSPATTGFNIFSNAQTYNGESVGAGDILMGDNSSTKANIFWDASVGSLYIRLGTEINGTISPSVFSLGHQAKLYRNTNQSINNSTYTTVTFDGYSFLDGFSYTAPDTLVVGQTGTYQIIIRASWDINATGIRDLGLTVNGSPSYPIDSRAALSGFYTNLLGIEERPLTAGDLIKLTAYQTSGGSLNLIRAGLMIRRIR